MSNFFALNGEDKSIMYNSDIICLVETWCLKDVNFLGELARFKCIQHNAKKLSVMGRGIGGMILLVDEQKLRIQNVTTGDNYIIIITNNIQSGDLLLIASLYVQPSPEKDDVLIDIFASIENLMESFPTAKVMILGDLNARISDDNIKSINLQCTNYLFETRESPDKVKTSRGRLLGELCANLDLTVINGRSADDVKGNFTYISTNGNSCIDLALCNPEVLNHVKQFKILNIPNSKHLPLTLTLGDYQINTSKDEKLKWHSEKRMIIKIYYKPR